MGVAAWVLVLGRLIASEPVPASTPAPVIVWEAPASCPSQAEVAREIEARVGARQLEVRASVRESEAGFVAALAIASETGTTQRSLTSPVCVTLVDAVVLLAVVATDPVPTIESIAPRLRDADAIPEPSAPAPARIAPLPMIDPPPVEPLAPKTTTKPPRSRRIQPRAAVFAVVGGRTLPGIDVGVRGAIGLATRRVHVDVTALWLAPRVAERDDVRATIDAWTVGLRVCPVVPLPTDRVELPICAVVGAGQLRGRAEGDRLIAQAPRRAPWVTAAVAPELAIVVHRLVRIVAGLEVGSTVVGPGFAVERLGRMSKPRPWIARGQLGLEVRFR
jgi:hypothetical protein